MFQRALKLILTQSNWPVGSVRESDELQADITSNLLAVQHAKCPYDCPAVTGPCIRFVRGESWTLIYLWIKCKRGWPGGSIEPDALASIEASLWQHFEPLIQGD